MEQLSSYAHESKKIKHEDEHVLIDQVANKLDDWVKRHKTRTNPGEKKKMPDEFLKGIVEKAKIDDAMDLGLAVVGAGASASLVEVVRSWLPEQTEGMADEALATAVSALIFLFGDKLHARLTPFGLGALLSSAGAWSAEYTKGLFAMLMKKEA